MTEDDKDVGQPTPIWSALESVSFSSEIFSGPLPHPEILRAYNEVLPGAAARILEKFEAQSDHRRRIESDAVRANIQQTVLGQVFALVVLLALIGGGSFLLHEGRDIGGLATIAAAVCAAVIVFFRIRARSPYTAPPKPPHT